MLYLANFNQRIYLFLFSLSRFNSTSSVVFLGSDNFFRVWGSSEFKVSGTIQMVRAPDIISGIPRIVVGNGFQYLANSPEK